ncbi:TetR/AcrR family transcriptional regulator [Leifsonia sp. NPDC056824]|uniref:TetR/AcrR family transcriptional regulator n=1 Tax=Leifsonia sp. NPDC056824 TaxID=3345953 RepID=UPI0036B61B74
MTETTAARSLTVKGERTRAKIVEVAASLMFQDGVAGTTVETVCEAAGVGKSQIYHYFHDKAELVRTVIESHTERILSAYDPFLSTVSGWESWDDWRDFIVDAQRDAECIGGCPLGSLARELVDCDDLTRALLIRSFQRWELALMDAVQRMKDLGLIRPEANNKFLATALLAGLQGGFLLCQTWRDVMPLQASLNSAIGLLRMYAA